MPQLQADPGDWVEESQATPQDPGDWVEESAQAPVAPPMAAPMPKSQILGQKLGLQSFGPVPTAPQPPIDTTSLPDATQPSNEAPQTTEGIRARTMQKLATIKSQPGDTFAMPWQSLPSDYTKGPLWEDPALTANEAGIAGGAARAASFTPIGGRVAARTFQGEEDLGTTGNIARGLTRGVGEAIIANPAGIGAMGVAGSAGQASDLALEAMRERQRTGQGGGLLDDVAEGTGAAPILRGEGGIDDYARLASVPVAGAAQMAGVKLGRGITPAFAKGTWEGIKSVGANAGFDFADAGAETALNLVGQGLDPNSQEFWDRFIPEMKMNGLVGTVAGRVMDVPDIRAGRGMRAGIDPIASRGKAQVEPQARPEVSEPTPNPIYDESFESPIKATPEVSEPSPQPTRNIPAELGDLENELRGEFDIEGRRLAEEAKAKARPADPSPIQEPIQQAKGVDAVEENQGQEALLRPEEQPLTTNAPPEPTVNPAKGASETFDEFSATRGVPATPPDFPEYYIAQGGVSKPSTAKAQAEAEEPVFSAKQASVEQSRSDRKWLKSVSPIPSKQREKVTKWTAEAREKNIDADAVNISKEVLETGRRLTNVETAGLGARFAALENELDNLHRKGMEGNLDPEAETMNNRRMDDLERDYDTVGQAIYKSGTDWGREGVARQIDLRKSTMSLADMEFRAKRKKGKPLAPEEKAQLKKVFEDTDANVKKTAEETVKADEAEAQDLINGSRTKRKKRSKAELDKEVGTLYAEARRLYALGCNTQ